MGEHETREGNVHIILRDPEGRPLLERVEIDGRILFSGRPGTIFHESAYIASMSDTPRPPPLDDSAERRLQCQFEGVILPWYRELTQ